MHHQTRNRRLPALSHLCFLALLAAPLALEAQETQDSTRLPAAMRSTRDSLNTAMTGLNAAQASKFFADSAVVSFQGEVSTGRPAVEAWLVGALQGVSKLVFGPSTFRISESEVTDRAGYTVTTADGVEPSGTTEAVWRRQPDGSWKVVRLTVT